jgi:hypothetical protein
MGGFVLVAGLPNSPQGERRRCCCAWLCCGALLLSLLALAAVLAARLSPVAAAAAAAGDGGAGGSTGGCGGGRGALLAAVLGQWQPGVGWLAAGAGVAVAAAGAVVACARCGPSRSCLCWRRWERRRLAAPRTAPPGSGALDTLVGRTAEQEERRRRQLQPPPAERKTVPVASFVEDDDEWLSAAGQQHGSQEECCGQCRHMSLILWCRDDRAATRRLPSRRPTAQGKAGWSREALLWLALLQAVGGSALLFWQVRRAKHRPAQLLSGSESL